MKKVLLLHKVALPLFLILCCHNDKNHFTTFGFTTLPANIPPRSYSRTCAFRCIRCPSWFRQTSLAKKRKVAVLVASSPREFSNESDGEDNNDTSANDDYNGNNDSDKFYNNNNAGVVEYEYAYPPNDLDFDYENEEEELEEADFLKRTLAQLESLDEILTELELEADLYQDNEDEDDDDTDNDELDAQEDDEDEEDPIKFLTELFDSIDDDFDDELYPEPSIKSRVRTPPQSVRSSTSLPLVVVATRELESALLQGVVPVSAGVGDDSLPGDFGFDPLQLSKMDLFLPAQTFLLNLLVPAAPPRSQPPPAINTTTSTTVTANANTRPRPRPRALILRDYREAEIRHSRLAMLAAIVWPLQEMLDRLILEPDHLFGPLLYGPVTLPYFPLAMTLILLLLGYLDIYSQAIKDMDDLGDAYLPGDCFWDPLRILTGTSDITKRRMQERELFNGRAAMLAVLAFVWEEAITHKPIIEVPGNELLFQPAYQIPFIQAWLDAQFLPR